jgi:hypothetical protein
MTSDLDLFATVSGYACVDGNVVKLWEGLSVEITPCELRGQTTSNVLYNRRNPDSALAEPLRGSWDESPGKFGKETITGAHRRPKWTLYHSAQAH